MAYSFLLVAADPAVPGAKNARLKTVLEAAGHTVTYGDDDSAEVAAGTKRVPIHFVEP